MAASTGFGMTLTGEGVNTKIREITWSGASRKEINVSSIASTDGMDYLPSALYDAGSFKVVCLYDANLPTWGVAATITAAFPGGTVACSGFLSGFEVSSPYDGEVVSTATFKLTGALS